MKYYSTSIISISLTSIARSYLVYANDLSLVDFQGLLFSEVNSEIAAQQQLEDDINQDRRSRGRFLRQADVTKEAIDLWNDIVQHGWDLSEYLDKSNMLSPSCDRRGRRNLQGKDDHLEGSLELKSNYFPFLVCSQSTTEMSAFGRLKLMLNRTDVLFQDALVVRNDPMKTCYHVSMLVEDAKLIRDASKENLTIVPMTDLMKIQVDTMSMVYEDSWSVPKKASPDDWERLIQVGLSVGHRMNLNTEEVNLIAKEIINDIQFLSRGGTNQPKKVRRNLGEINNNINEAGSTPKSSVSISDLFSLTATTRNYKNQEMRKLSKKSDNYASNRWSRALKEGLEEAHYCKAMFDTLILNAHHNNQGFDIILNPAPVSKECIASLIIALSIHPLVLSIEAEGPVISNDYESQWITQTKTIGSRPLRNIGINGENQIISIIDSGLDINHMYFGPTDEKIFYQWDYTQRKVVRYDHSIGDKIEAKGGHGTMCAGAAVGESLDSSNDVANGIAEGAKLHILDIVDSRYRMPSAFTIFESMHDTKGKPARIANGSYGTPYRAYPFSCRFLDEALHGQFQGDLYVASAGNQGLDETTMQSVERTILNPASCKNSLAVGANQSHGDRIGSGSHGIDYIAAFSSRGPTYDGRMKPDVVAPGASVLTAYAHESNKTVQVHGTSYSAPTVAGNAALVRQYFEEGRLPCGRANCELDPSGSLLKAVLMNSANPVKQVQVSRPWLEQHKLEEVTEYDHNQGMGLIQLDTTLPIPGHNKFNAVVRNNEEIGDGEYHDIFIRATPGKCFNTPYRRDFRATLAWYDPAGTSSCAKCLINDLDIVVQKVTRRGSVKSQSEVFPNGANHKDFDNNVERIRFQMGRRQRYRIRIKASNLASATTTYSMIATGCFRVIN